MDIEITRLKGEPTKSYERLQEYVHFEGTLKEFAESEGVSESTIKQASSKWKWSERISEYHIQQDKKLQEEIDDLFKELNQAGLNDMQSFFSELNEVKDDLLTRFRNREIVSSTVLVSLKDYIYCYRQATELYYINCRKPLEPPEEVESRVDMERNEINKVILSDEHFQTQLEFMKKLINED